uniref:Metalloendopeptidase n=1 Tax=Strongyloides stercoralis TaxID=6248 RepID=A0AAF5D8N8_STRER
MQGIKIILILFFISSTVYYFYVINNAFSFSEKASVFESFQSKDKIMDHNYININEDYKDFKKPIIGKNNKYSYNGIKSDKIIKNGKSSEEEINDLNKSEAIYRSSEEKMKNEDESIDDSENADKTEEVDSSLENESDIKDDSREYNYESSNKSEENNEEKEKEEKGEDNESIEDESGKEDDNEEYSYESIKELENESESTEEEENDSKIKNTEENSTEEEKESGDNESMEKENGKENDNEEYSYESTKELESKSESTEEEEHDSKINNTKENSTQEEEGSEENNNESGRNDDTNEYSNESNKKSDEESKNTEEEEEDDDKTKSTEEDDDKIKSTEEDSTYEDEENEYDDETKEKDDSNREEEESEDDISTNENVKSDTSVDESKESNKNNLKNNRVKRYANRNMIKKWAIPIYYHIEKVKIGLIKQAINEIEKETCIKFMEVPNTTKVFEGIHFFNGSQCTSTIGRKNDMGWQDISINNNCCTIGKVLYEILRTLGLYEEHNRIDRNNYVYILKESIDPSKLKLFNILPVIKSLPYDYGSLTHGDQYFLTSSDQLTIIPKNPLYEETIGQRNKLSFLDIKTLNYFYCSKRCWTRIKCFNGGYQDPKNCKRCKCVEGYTGVYCDKIINSSKMCGKSLLIARSTLKTLSLSGLKNCIYHIKAKRFHKIVLIINGALMREKTLLKPKKLTNGIMSGQTINDVRNNFNIFNYSYIRMKRRIQSGSLNRWNLQIPYFVDKNVDRILIRQSLNQLELETCIRFKEMKYMAPGMSGIRYYYGNTCSSRVGKVNGVQWQRISIGDKCDDKGRVQHETLHALGIDHEHTRPDRNNFLFIIRRNIIDKTLRNFHIASPDIAYTLNIPFDYGSLMHYDIHSFSKNGYITMLPKDELYKKTIGHLRDLSFNDIKTLNLYYCSNKCPKRIKCFNGGYQNPNICNTCKCVEGFTGKKCKLLSKSPPSCGKTFFYAKSISQEIKGGGGNYCIYHIKARNRRKIGLNVIFSNIYLHEAHVCETKNTLEIKYWNDKTVTGARFCGHTSQTIFISKSNYVIIYFRSTKLINKFKLTFRKM